MLQATNTPKKLRIIKKRQTLARNIRQCQVQDFYQQLVQADIERAFIVFENGQFKLSHPEILAPVQAFFELSQDFGNHEGVFIGRADGLESLFFAFVHDTRRGLAQGGLRFSHYESIADVFVDGLRLSQGMTRKNALAGLWWGGGKGIMTLPPGFTHPKEIPAGPERRQLFEAYGRFVASLGGIYYTAEDVGTNTADMQAILSQNRFTTCIPPQNGGSGNPSPFTARGVLRAMQAAWQVLTGEDHLRGVKVAVQGTGNVGAPLIRYLDDLGAKVWITDVNQASLQELLQERPHLQAVESETIFDLPVDIFAPCATGAQINVTTIPRLKVKLVCGAANNILKEPADAERLRQRGIAFVPDFVSNRMGIINCADEWQGYLSEDIRKAADRVFPDTLRVFKYAHNRYTTTSQAANDLADIAAGEVHPLMGHRGRRLIDHLLQSDWHRPQSRKIKDHTVEPAFIPVLDEPAVRLKWEQQQRPVTAAQAIVSTPISAAWTPNLAAFLAPLLMDIRARSLEWVNEAAPRRVVGSDHGGLALQIAIEQNHPYSREEIGRDEFVVMCRDLSHRHDTQIREQLHQLGIDFEPQNWLNPMRAKGGKTINALYHYLSKAQLITCENWLAHHCPRCRTVLVSSDLSHGRLHVHEAYELVLQTSQGKTLSTHFYFPEYLLGVVAVAVSPQGPYAHLIDQQVTHPLYNQPLPVLAREGADIELIAPLFRRQDEKFARENQLSTPMQIFDDNGLVCAIGYEGLSLEQARQQILEHLPHTVKIYQGSWRIEVLRCRRCESVVQPRYSEELFVSFEEAVLMFRQALESDKITTSHPFWKKRLLHYLDEMEPWCISRQYWWGNDIPDRKPQVFSTWFSLVAWALQGAGWPDNPKPVPLDEVFTDPEFLLRWIVPAQLVSLLVTGRPLFRHIHVHGTVHVVELALKTSADIPANIPDEERFVLHSIRRPMRPTFGNVIEPATLIRRFGADALRLGYLLCLEAQPEAQDMITLAESRLQEARSATHRLISKITGLLKVLNPHQTTAGEPYLLDYWLIHQTQLLAEQARQAYQLSHWNQAARTLLRYIEYVANYANAIPGRWQHKQSVGAMGAAIAESLALAHGAFGPICPFVLDKLAQETSRYQQGLACPAAVTAWLKQPQQSLGDLALSNMAQNQVEWTYVRGIGVNS